VKYDVTLMSESWPMQQTKMALLASGFLYVVSLCCCCCHAGNTLCW
jgi:hypothetical protein